MIGKKPPLLARHLSQVTFPNVPLPLSQSPSQPLRRLRHRAGRDSPGAQNQPLDLVHLPADRRPRPFLDLRAYALRDLAEACEYLRDPLLRARYEEIAGAVSDQLARGVSVENLMGGRTDALKLVSSLTLFRAAAQRLAAKEATFDSLAQRCDSVLRQTSAQGYRPCVQTLVRVIG